MLKHTGTKVKLVTDLAPGLVGRSILQFLRFWGSCTFLVHARQAFYHELLSEPICFLPSSHPSFLSFFFSQFGNVLWKAEVTMRVFKIVIFKKTRFYLYEPGILVAIYIFISHVFESYAYSSIST